ncbi:hypothetical protein P691DRAFT_791497 [Macrolepiota fuliginosa MF-IS2]|uniref:Uncharacterized protein n=1 Tax=Macrolepiota fuliginosa MF-IS2 TaxID=1400762 RepID=A0A9P6BXD9_9AGAR|nr:hypothetical protein P691DRAFT_791497 [Macrolepiota fuliginosa MF-IS2]
MERGAIKERVCYLSNASLRVVEKWYLGMQTRHDAQGQQSTIVLRVKIKGGWVKAHNGLSCLTGHGLEGQCGGEKAVMGRQTQTMAFLLLPSWSHWPVQAHSRFREWQNSQTNLPRQDWVWVWVENAWGGWGRSQQKGKRDEKMKMVEIVGLTGMGVTTNDSVQSELVKAHLSAPNVGKFISCAYFG